MKVFGEYIIVKPIAETVSASGIVITPQASGDFDRGDVVYVGDLFDMKSVQEGDTIYYKRECGRRLFHMSTDYIVVPLNDVVAVY